ncbi:PREDICTED: uncharacterized protein LOC104604198 [Nelumbo nucifera]|uniref:Uncharacterized protein LOC104604198 n=1 Tax=Nelumbo nucifera TaxID=4432 RepID=A0A1U8AHX2_NELNU|nr:PREDICTED: uncharacterized protein LOC104604198 [Nelumbo nucifera]
MDATSRGLCRQVQLREGPRNAPQEGKGDAHCGSGPKRRRDLRTPPALRGVRAQPEELERNQRSTAPAEDWPVTPLMPRDTEKYINAKEVQTQLRDEEERPDKRRRDTEERKPERSDRDHKRQDHRPDRRPRTPPPTYWNFTLLNMPRSEVLMQIRDRNYIRWPEKMKTQSNKRNREKYCEFHRDHGHDTKNCFDLRKHIEDLIRRGFIKSEIAARGESSSGRKKYARLCEIDNRGHKKKRGQTITFTDDDLQWVQTPHDDALVITVKVAKLEIRWILVDTGSSTDVLFEDAFEKFGINKECLTPVNTPLMGFSGESLLPTGRITLPLLIGDSDVTTRTMVDFTVVRCPSSYNAILGRPTLNALQAAVSTFHLAMKFPTE